MILAHRNATGEERIGAWLGGRDDNDRNENEDEQHGRLREARQLLHRAAFAQSGEVRRIKRHLK